MDIEAVQRSWDAQQEIYLPDREERFAAMLDIVEAVAGDAPRVLDLAGGTGSITRRLLARLPKARAVVVDIDPVLLAIAEATFAGDHRVLVVRADLDDPAWSAAIPASSRPFDAVLTATALHWLVPSRVASLYAEAGDLLRPGGVFGNADHMPDGGLPGLGSRLDAVDAERAARRRQESGIPDWDGWWSQMREVPELAAALNGRATPGSGHTRSAENSAWHVAALRDAGFAESGLVWRGGEDALAVGVRP